MHGYRFPATVFFLLFWCAPAYAAFSVHWQGALQSVHRGEVAGTVDLEQFAGRPQLYAVGPAANLDGEVTAIDGRFHIARMRHQQIHTDRQPAGSAVFLVWAEVSQWRPAVTLGRPIADSGELEQLIETMAAAAGLDTSQPFPFLLEGHMAAVDYHIVVPPSASAAAGRHSDQAAQFSLRASPATLIGFFSKKHPGIFIHRGSASHMHIVAENGHSGHVDAVRLDESVRLILPQ